MKVEFNKEKEPVPLESLNPGDTFTFVGKYALWIKSNSIDFEGRIRCLRLSDGALEGFEGELLVHLCPMVAVPEPRNS